MPRRALSDPRYYEEQRVPKWSGRPTLLQVAGHTGAGPVARGTFREMSKADHLRHAQRFARLAGRWRKLYGSALTKAVKRYGHPAGTHTSGIYNPKFSERIKNQLRSYLHNANDLTSASVAHYEAAGKRTPWRDSPLKKLAFPGQGLYGSHFGEVRRTRTRSY